MRISLAWATCVALLLPGVAYAIDVSFNDITGPGPEGVDFIYLGYNDLGGGEYEHHYTMNHNVPVVNPTFQTTINDVHWDVAYSAAHVRGGGPGDWYLNWDGPLSFLETPGGSSDGVIYESEVAGFYIVANTPSVTTGGIWFTDENHQQVATDETYMPLPEPSSALLLLSGFVFLLRRRR